MRRTGFTLIEMLVVVAVIISLLGILVVAVGPAMETASIVGAKNFLTSISASTVAFERDHGFYPPSQVGTGSPMNNWEGAELITQALAGPAANVLDGVDGYGAKKMNDDGSYRNSGRTYGPYLEIKNDSTLLPRWDQNTDSQQKGELWSTPRNSSDRRNAYVLTMASSASRLPVLYYRLESTTGDWDYDTYPPGFPDQEAAQHNYDYGDPFRDASYWNTRPSETDFRGTPGPAENDRDALAMSIRAAKFMLVATGPDDEYGTEDDIIVTGP